MLEYVVHVLAQVWSTALVERFANTQVPLCDWSWSHPVWFTYKTYILQLVSYHRDDHRHTGMADSPDWLLEQVEAHVNRPDQDDDASSSSGNEPQGCTELIIDASRVKWCKEAAGGVQKLTASQNLDKSPLQTNFRVKAIRKQNVRAWK